MVGTTFICPDLVLALGLEPDVSYRLEGTIRKAGNTVRIAVFLTDRSSGFTVWSDEFDSDMEDIFALQEQAALRIIQALGVQLRPQESIMLSARDTDNPAAYDSFLRGWSVIESLHVSLVGAAEKLKEAAREALMRPKCRFRETPFATTFLRRFDVERPVVILTLAHVLPHEFHEAFAR